eukprot:5620901-Amphidinium_carterae.1
MMQLMGAIDPKCCSMLGSNMIPCMRLCHCLLTCTTDFGAGVVSVSPFQVLPGVDPFRHVVT